MVSACGLEADMGGGHRWLFVTTDLDTLLTALYVLVDDHVIDSGPPRCGHPKRLADAELVCLAAAQVLLGARSEHHWLRLCYGRLGHLFPYLPKQPGYHKRIKAAAPLVCKTMLVMAALCPSWSDELRLLDATPVPCGASRQTVRRSELAGWASYGYCAAHSRWYWGLKLYLLTTAEGMPSPDAWPAPGPGSARSPRSSSSAPATTERSGRASSSSRTRAWPARTSSSSLPGSWRSCWHGRTAATRTSAGSAAWAG
jgi:hypothetical protein